ncbi:MAG: hypothetical protein OXJ53_05540 [Gammaproteobacteria bacterium]|nr:hypothetical protein [Gammaproteobacteria bacterium]
MVEEGLELTALVVVSEDHGQFGCGVPTPELLEIGPLQIGFGKGAKGKEYGNRRREKSQSHAIAPKLVCLSAQRRKVPGHCKPNRND